MDSTNLFQKFPESSVNHEEPEASPPNSAQPLPTKRSSRSNSTTSATSHTTGRRRSGSSELALALFSSEFTKVSYRDYEPLFSQAAEEESRETQESKEQGRQLIQKIRQLHGDIQTGQKNIDKRIKDLGKNQSSWCCCSASPPEPMPETILKLLSFYQSGVTNVPASFETGHPLLIFKEFYENEDIKKLISRLVTTITSLYKEYDKLKDIAQTLEQRDL